MQFNKPLYFPSNKFRSLLMLPNASLRMCMCFVISSLLLYFNTIVYASSFDLQRNCKQIPIKLQYCPQHRQKPSHTTLWTSTTLYNTPTPSLTLLSLLFPYPRSPSLNCFSATRCPSLSFYLRDRICLCLQLIANSAPDKRTSDVTENSLIRRHPETNIISLRHCDQLLRHNSSVGWFLPPYQTSWAPPAWQLQTLRYSE